MILHQLTYNSNDESCCTVSDYALGDFDLCAFWRKGRLDTLDLRRLALDIGRGKAADYLPNPLSLPIVSERLMAHLQSWRSCAFFTPLAPAIRRSRGAARYFLVEFARSHRSVMKGERFVPSAVPKAFDFFRVHNSAAGSLLFSDACAKSFIGKAFRPVAFIRRHPVLVRTGAARR